MRLFNLQEWLSILNGSWGMAAVCLGLVMLAYLSHEGVARRIWIDAKLTIGMRIALSLFLLTFGVFITRVDIYIWRMMGAGVFSERQAMILFVGAFIGTAGFTWATKEYSEPLFGSWVWILSAVATVLTGLGTAIWILSH